ncbi:hypothetical protein BDQ17DRAFT_1369792 [Cyathus striatus]|nr:hypothetical protein BDQ17DRAFT_1369792 [Cyathus striatus]
MQKKNFHQYPHDYAKWVLFQHIVQGLFDESLLYELKQCIPDIIHQLITHVHFEKQLSDLLDMHFYLERPLDSSSEVKALLQHILNYIYPVIDEFLRPDIKENGYYHLNNTMAIIKRRKFPHLIYDAKDCWKATMLESPVRGRNLYLSSDKSQDIFRSIWEINDTEITDRSFEDDRRAWRLFALEIYKKEVVPNIEGQILEAFELWLKPEELSENEWCGWCGWNKSIHPCLHRSMRNVYSPD